MVEVNWSDEAEITFDLNINYLLSEWTQKEVKNFIQQTQYVISRLQEHPESYNPSIKNKKVRRARLNKYVTLFYRYYSTRKEIILLSFWNTKQNPGRLKY